MGKFFLFEHHINFHETDAAGVAHFSRFALWVEAAEEAFWRENGTALPRFENGVLQGFPRVGFSIRYKKPARLNDKIAVKIHPRHDNDFAPLVWDFHVFREDELLADGAMTVLFARVSGAIFETLPLTETLKNILGKY